MERILSKLREPKVNNSGGFMAFCPAHPDGQKHHKRSLWVKEDKNGNANLHCFAGCSLSDILVALGLDERDLHPQRERKQRREVIAEYVYTDEQGTRLFRVVRTRPKGFYQQRADGKGAWKNGLGDVRRVLYCLPEVLAAAQAGRLVYIVEGEKDADALAKLGLVATTNAGGAAKWRMEYNEALHGAQAIILPDNDEAGRKHAVQVATYLQGMAASIKIVELPSLPEKGDVSDWLAAGGTAEALTALAKKTSEWAPTAFTGVEGNDARPQILVSEQFLRDISTEAVAALIAANQPPALFRRGADIVRIDADGVAEPLSVAALRGHLDRVANFVRLGRHGEHVPARPPLDTVQDIAALPAPDVPLPYLRGIRRAPCFLPGGRLLATNGYDAESGLLMTLDGLQDPDMPLEDARHLLMDELLHDFPFAHEAGRAHTLALILLPFVRDLINGPTPLHLVDAPSRGTGKGLLADVCAIVATGRVAYVMSLTGDEETEKRVTATLLAGWGSILLDNVQRLGGSVLPAVLTATNWRGRRLGKSEMVSVPNDSVWLATGNNIALSDEMPRRILPIRLDAGVERPEERSGWRHSDLLGWAVSNRPLLVGAAIAVVRRWFDMGAPAWTGKPLGRFESYCRVMGGILECVGVPGFLEGRHYLYDDADRGTNEWRALVAVWAERFGECPVTARDVLDVAKDNQLLLDFWGGRSDLAAQQRLGRALADRRDRVFGDFAIRAAGRDTHTKTLTYKLGVAPQTPQTPQKASQPAPQPDFRLRGFGGATPQNPAETPQAETQAQSGFGGGLRGLRGLSAPPSPCDDAETHAQSFASPSKPAPGADGDERSEPWPEAGDGYDFLR